MDSSTVQVSEQTADDRTCASKPAGRIRHVRLVLFPVLSAALPGSGQIIAGQVGAATIWFTAFCAALSVQWISRLPFTYNGLLLSSAVWIAVAAASCIHTYSVVRRSQNGKWWFLPVVLVIGGVASNYLHGTVWRVQGVKPFTVPSTSMEPTILSGEGIVVDMHWYRTHQIARGDLIAYRRDDTYFIKRVIGEPGDTLEGENGNIYRNGTLLNEPYAVAGVPLHDFPPVLVQAGELFVAGDNRPLSYDSRINGHGLVKDNEVVGKPMYVFKSPIGGREGVPLL